jgi:general secretion pathway protein H
MVRGLRNRLRGRRPCRLSGHRARRGRGFTLIELLVVIVVIGIALATVSVTGLPGAREGLQFEAARLAQLLYLAREEAQVRGLAIRLQTDRARFRFVMLAGNQWQPVLDDPDLRERAWQEPTEVQVLRPDGRDDVEFGRSSIDVPFSLTLSRGPQRVTIAANGLGAFEVQ